MFSGLTAPARLSSLCFLLFLLSPSLFPSVLLLDVILKDRPLLVIKGGPQHPG